MFKTGDVVRIVRNQDSIEDWKRDRGTEPWIWELMTIDYVCDDRYYEMLEDGSNNYWYDNMIELHQTALEKRMYKIVEKLWWDIHILSAIGSRKDTLPDEEVLEVIDLRLEDKLQDQIKVIASV